MNEAYRELDPKLWQDQIFSLLGEEWALVTAGNEEKCNTMTVSWGGIGVLWGKPMATLYIRPQRYTREFMEQEDFVSLSFLEEGHKKELAFCGKESGRTVDKFKECNFQPVFQAVADGVVPFVDKAKLVFLCRKQAVMPMVAEALPEDVKERWYPKADYHLMYFCEIVGILEKI